jgi:deoxyribonuclease-4
MATMLPDGRRIGAHLPLATGMVRAAERAHEIGADAIQIFTDNPTAWRRRAEPPTDVEAFRRGLVEYAIGPVAIHAAYLVNLAGSDPRSIDRSVAILAQEICGAPDFGARFVNVHIGSHLGDGPEIGTRRLVTGIGRVLATVRADVPGPRLPAMLVLENSAGSGGGLGTTVAELAGIARALDESGVARDEVGFCLDTAHAWGAGIDVGDPDAIDATLDEFDRSIGLDRLVMVHLNDSRSQLGSRADRHEHLGAGRIGATGLAHVLRHPGLAHAATIIETPGMSEGYDAINLERARALAAGRPLDELPADAFDRRGSAASRTAPR